MFNYIVKESKIIVGNILLLTMQPERLAEQIKFYPGQYAAISFYLGSRPSPTRCFSIVSSPRDKYLQFAIRISGDFTTAASLLQPGDRLKVTGPYGQFTIDPEYDDSLVFIAGGIGITPFMSILRYATEVNLDKPIRLFYSNRSQNNIPFQEELIELEKNNPNLKVAYFITDGDVDPIPGTQRLGGFISENALAQVTNNWKNGITYFICGPTSFRKTYEGIISTHINDPDRLVTESFTQATKLSVTSKFSIPTLTYTMTALALLFGTGFIMSLDLARAVPKLVNASVASNSTTTTTTPTTSTNNSSSNSSTTTTTTTPTQTYYQPVTRVS